MTKSKLTTKTHFEYMECMMFASHTMNFWIPLYHYHKMVGRFGDLPIHEWIFEGIPKEYIAPPQEIEVMNDFQSFHSFRKSMIKYLYNYYVEKTGSDENG